MNRSISHRFVLSLVCIAMVASFSLGSFGRGPSARAADASGRRAKPSLMDISKPAVPQKFVVTGKDFTPGGKVYIAIYDQVGRQLYEHRWVYAKPAPDPYRAAMMEAAGIA